MVNVDESELQNQTPDAEFVEEVPVKEKFSFGLAQLSNGMLSGIALGGAITFFYNYKIGLSAYYTSIAWLVFAIWNAINDPLFGFLEDQTNTKWGRRVPYLRFGAPFYCILFILCWYPWGNSQIELFWSFLINLMAFDTLYTIIGLVTYSLPAEMCISGEQRSQILVYGTYIGSLGIVISTIVPMFFLAEKETTLNPAFRPVMIVLGLTSMCLMIYASFNITENEYARIEEPLPIIEGLKQTLKNKPFLIFEASNFSFTLAQTMLTTGLYYYTSLVLDLQGGIMSALPIAFVFGIAMLMTVYFSKKVQEYGLKKVYIFGLVWGGLGFVIIAFVGRTFTGAAIMLSLVGAGFSAVLVTAQAIFADCIDYDETQTGKRRETTYSGVNALLSNKPAISIANAAFLWIIEQFGYMEPEEGVTYIPSNEVKIGIMVGVALLPGIFMLFTALIMKKYPLDGSEWRKTKKKLEVLHIKKENAYVDYIKELEENPEKIVMEPDLSQYDARKLGFSIPWKLKTKNKMTTSGIWLIIILLLMVATFVTIAFIQQTYFWLILAIIMPVLYIIFWARKK